MNSYLAHLTSILFPTYGGDRLDSHKSFIVTYTESGDKDLAYHYDNAEVTLNVSLGDGFEGSTLYFGGLNTELNANITEYNHRKCYGVLHRGQHMHGADTLESGHRSNFIMWCRSSRIRNQCCPMCLQKPTLCPVKGRGDGFTSETMNCSIA